MKKTRVSIVLAVMCALALVIGSLAFFTDRITANTVAQAGTLDLTLTTPRVSKTENFKPGEGITIDFTLSNLGKKSADVRELLVLTSTKAMTGSENVLCEFELYNAADVTLTDGVAAIRDGAKPVAARSVSQDGLQITYTIPEFVLNGTGGAEAEIEPEANGKYSKASAYVLVFAPGSGNTYQNVTLTLDYEAQAKQHRNTDSTMWATVMTETVNFAGNDAHPAVPVMPANP